MGSLQLLYNANIFLCCIPVINEGYTIGGRGVVYLLCWGRNTVIAQKSEKCHLRVVLVFLLFFCLVGVFLVKNPKFVFDGKINWSSKKGGWKLMILFPPHPSPHRVHVSQLRSVLCISKCIIWGTLSSFGKVILDQREAPTGHSIRLQRDLSSYCLHKRPEEGLS